MMLKACVHVYGQVKNLVVTLEALYEKGLNVGS